MPLEDVAPANTYPTKGGGPNDFVHITCSRAPGSAHFANLCRCIGREDLLDDPRMATPQSRYKYKEELDAIITEWTLQHTKQEAMEIIAKADIPAGALLDIDDIAHDPSYVETGMVVEIDHPQRGHLKFPGFASRMSENHVEYACSPALGGSNDEIYRGILGLSAEELAELKDKKVI